MLRKGGDGGCRVGGAAALIIAFAGKSEGVHAQQPLLPTARHASSARQHGLAASCLDELIYVSLDGVVLLVKRVLRLAGPPHIRRLVVLSIPEEQVFVAWGASNGTVQAMPPHPCSRTMRPLYPRWLQLTW